MLTEIEMNTKVCGKCKEVKTLEGFSKMKASKDGRQSKCKACAKDLQAKYRAANPEKNKERSAKYYAANSEDIKEYNAEYYAANSEDIKEYNAEYHAANPEKRKESHAKYYAANPEKFRAWSSKRRAAKLEAIPSWLTEEDWQSMDDINEEADRLTKETGVKYEVDHIHPLRGKLICGLQCPSNLQILTRSENRSKGNKFTPYVEIA